MILFSTCRFLSSAEKKRKKKKKSNSATISGILGRRSSVPAPPLSASIFLPICDTVSQKRCLVVVLRLSRVFQTPATQFSVFRSFRVPFPFNYRSLYPLSLPMWSRKTPKAATCSQNTRLTGRSTEAVPKSVSKSCAAPNGWS